MVTAVGASAAVLLALVVAVASECSPTAAFADLDEPCSGSTRCKNFLTCLNGSCALLSEGHACNSDSDCGAFGPLYYCDKSYRCALTHRYFLILRRAFTPPTAPMESIARATRIAHRLCARRESVHQPCTTATLARCKASVGSSAVRRLASRTLMAC